MGMRIRGALVEQGWEGAAGAPWVSSQASEAVLPGGPSRGDWEGNIPATEIIRDRHGNGGAIKARFSWEQLCALYLP